MFSLGFVYIHRLVCSALKILFGFVWLFPTGMTHTPYSVQEECMMMILKYEARKQGNLVSSTLLSNCAGSFV